MISHSPERDELRPDRGNLNFGAFQGGVPPKIAALELEPGGRFFSQHHNGIIVDKDHPKRSPGADLVPIGVGLVGFGRDAIAFAGRHIKPLSTQIPPDEQQFGRLVYKNFGRPAKREVEDPKIYTDLHCFCGEQNGVLCIVTPADHPEFHEEALRSARQWCRDRGFGVIVPMFGPDLQRTLTDQQLAPLVVSYVLTSAQPEMQPTKNGVMINDSILPVPIAIINLSGQSVLVNGELLAPLTSAGSEEGAFFDLEATFQQQEVREQLSPVASHGGPVIVLERRSISKLEPRFAHLVSRAWDARPESPYFDRSVYSVQPLSPALELRKIRRPVDGTHTIFQIAQREGVHHSSHGDEEST